MKQIIAVHGWGGDSGRWKDWIEAFKKDKWLWKSFDRGYGEISSATPQWSNRGSNNVTSRNVVICHSLGLHLIKSNILEKATDVVLLSSFSRFIPQEKSSRSLRIALNGMEKALGTQKEKTMFINFLRKCEYPSFKEFQPKTTLLTKLSLNGRKKLKEDLQLLIKSNSLPANFPSNARVLAIHGNEDLIINQSIKDQLIHDLNLHLNQPAINWNIPKIGHTLNNKEIILKVKKWLK